jgi:hypothetical protein
MKVIQVTYTTTADFSAQNQQNILKVLSDLAGLKDRSISYNACLSADNKTFIHTAYFSSDEGHRILSELPSFKLFQQQLKESGCEVSPKQELLQLLGSSTNLFN